MGSLKFSTLTIVLVAAIATASAQEQQNGGDTQAFRFRSGVELINVTATVSDGHGRFVSGLRQEDFRVYEDGQPRPITHFTSERVPVSLGIVLDTSGSMEGEKMMAARQALQRFLFDLLGPDDEVFLYRFDSRPERLVGWTSDRERIASEIRRIQPRGATTLYDAIAEAVPLAATGRHRKKALLIISDGNDTSSFTRITELKRMIHESEVLVYAIGISAMNSRTQQYRRPWFSTTWLGQRRPTPFPFPIPGRPGSNPPRGPSLPPPRYPPTMPPPNPGSSMGSRGDEPVNVAVLREITDDSGGRTEVIWQPGDLAPATASIADELSKQYFLGYPAASEKKDGKWHSIRVEVSNASYVVRARRGYVASP
jgi:Ca-activated chloride channel family protein